MIASPEIVQMVETPTLGIRIQTPMRGMSRQVDKLAVELFAWLKRQGITPGGPRYLRFYVIDMSGDMDIEFGVPVLIRQAGNGRVTAGVLPAGRYASLLYSGSGLAGNKALIEWAMASHLRWDRWDDPKGDAFRSRFESYLTDPKIEPRKTKWLVKVAIKLTDE